MIGAFSPQDVRRLAASLHASSGRADWSIRDFSNAKSAHMSRVALLAYCAVTESERSHHHRAKLVPSTTYRSIIRQERFPFDETVRGGDFEFVFVVESFFFVAIIVRIQSDIFIGIRGTLFAFDWGINLSARGERAGASLDLYGDRGIAHLAVRETRDEFRHRGFFREALIISHLVSDRIAPLMRFQQGVREPRIHVAGHSLGGAIAAMLADHGFRRHDDRDGGFDSFDTYIYGSPRIGSRRTVRRSVVYATRRPLDLVPHTPPGWLGYADFLLEYGTDGLPFVRRRALIGHAARWLGHIWIPRALSHHAMETYVTEIPAANWLSNTEAHDTPGPGFP